MTPPIHIIGEAGTNHGGSLDTSKKLIDVAATAKCDSVKFQIIYPEELYVLKLWQSGEAVDNPVIQARRKGMLSDADLRQAAAYATQSGIPFTASVFGEKSLDFYMSLKPPYVKVASCDLNNHRLLSACAERNVKLIVSTGMSTLGEIETSLNVLTKAGADDVVLLHCVSVYPAPVEIMNLSFIDTLKSAFGVPIGLSDHTESSLAVAIAVAKGVTWVEKHFTLDRQAEGFDHAYAMEPDMMERYVADIRACERALQAPQSKVGAQEASVRARARRALYAARDLPAGHVVTEADVLAVRPEGPLGLEELQLTVGARTKAAVGQYQPLHRALFDYPSG